ncbi:MAG: hypothetical protein CVV24_06755 [Ignavibacteriae bacterium HGW-Ignavibacteriae-3]|nr:MAG: hypothetical protein CVV24_06755 [Ignavibacteriae bacterium HGW-Ignavibacteriae-3]
MKRINSYLLSFSLIVVLLFIANGCNKNDGLVDPAQEKNLNTVLQKITDTDESVNSFTPNYNEGQAMGFLGVLGRTIYPLRIGQVINLVDRSLTIKYETETATGTLIEKFDGVLIISGSFNQPDPAKPSVIDTVIRKPLSTVVTRLIKYTKISSTGDNNLDWKIAGVSLPAGGTETSGVVISKLILVTQDGKTLEITNPNEFFFDRGFMNFQGTGYMNANGSLMGGNGMNGNGGMGGNGMNGIGNGMNGGMLGNGTHEMSAMFGTRQPLKMAIEVLSKFDGEDFLTLTHGAMMSSSDGRVKEKFELKSSVKEGTNYRKTYEIVWLTDSHGGFMHAVINAMPKDVVTDTDSKVEQKTWGIPYQVK